MRLTQAQYAKLKGVSRQYVSAEIKRGNLPLVDGKIEVTDEGSPKPAASKFPPIATSKQVEAAYKAKRAELEYREKQVQLVDAAAVQSRWFELARRVRDGMLQIPDRIADLLAAETDSTKVYATLRDEITLALRDLESAS